MAHGLVGTAVEVERFDGFFLVAPKAELLLRPVPTRAAGKGHFVLPQGNLYLDRLSFSQGNESHQPPGSFFGKAYGVKRITLNGCRNGQGCANARFMGDVPKYLSLSRKQRRLTWAVD